MLHVTVIEEIGELDSLRTDWERLWQATAGVSFFQSLDWLRTYWKHFGANQHLRVLVAEDHGKVMGIVPLVLRDEATRLGIVRVLTYPLHDWGTFYGPLGPNPAAILGSCLRHLSERRREWDLFDLRWVNEQEVDQDRALAALTEAGFPCRHGIWNSSAVIDFQGTWEQYLASRSSKFRNNLRRAETSAAQTGQVSYERYRPPRLLHGDGELRRELFTECLEVAERSWQGSSSTGTTISHEGVREFFRDLFAVAANCGALDINLLRIDDQPAAFTFNLHSSGALCGLRLGYDPAMAGASPGRLVIARSVADSFQRGDRYLDLGDAAMAFKQPWLTRTLHGCRYTHYPRSSWRAQLLRLKHGLVPRHHRDAPKWMTVE